jgi:hypothetical protein
MRLVCSEEKGSVEAAKMTAAQSRAGHQARSQSGNRERGGTRESMPANCDAGRGLRQDSEPDKSCSLEKIKTQTFGRSPEGRPQKNK